MLLDASRNLSLALLQGTRFFVVLVLRNSPQALPFMSYSYTGMSFPVIVPRRSAFEIAVLAAS
jgi:hypothetical protein